MGRKESTVIFYADYSRLSKLNLSGNNMIISKSNFLFTEISDSIFDKAIFVENKIKNASFIYTSFKQSCFRENRIENTKFFKCDFTDASFLGQSFEICTFVNCNFAECSLRSVTFTDCGFTNCDFIMASMPEYFHPVYMEDCTNVPYMPMACPDEGEFIGYKIAIHEYAKLSQREPFYVLITLRIPSDAKRSAAGGRKCRCDKAQVIAIEPAQWERKGTTIPIAHSVYDPEFKYRVGEEISVPQFDENPWNECAPGIHFFMNRKEALMYFDIYD